MGRRLVFTLVTAGLSLLLLLVQCSGPSFSGADGGGSDALQDTTLMPDTATRPDVTLPPDAVAEAPGLPDAVIGDAGSDVGSGDAMIRDATLADGPGAESGPSCTPSAIPCGNNGTCTAGIQDCCWWSNAMAVPVAECVATGTCLGTIIGNGGTALAVLRCADDTDCVGVDAGSSCCVYTQTYLDGSFVHSDCHSPAFCPLAMGTPGCSANTCAGCAVGSSCTAQACGVGGVTVNLCGSCPH